MLGVNQFTKKIDFLLTDIDDTLTDDGRLHANAYKALWDLKEAGVHVIPVTGRPAGWCEMIARFWPVSGVVGENGAFYFRYHGGKMIRHFAQSEKVFSKNRVKLAKIQKEILRKVRGSAVASDQFCRLADLAIDFCEDVRPLPMASVKKIVSIFESHGAQAKVSSIHVNGWFGKHNKLSQSLAMLEKEFKISANKAKTVCAFVGDSPNDEPMWEYFPLGFAVANINKFLNDLKFKPAYVASKSGGHGFVEIADRLIKAR